MAHPISISIREDDDPTTTLSTAGTDGHTTAAAPAPTPTRIAEGYQPLTERAVRDDGTIDLRIISPGWGSSGYYGRDVLERDIPRAFPPGTHMYWNHPTLTEDDNRPERDLRDLAAVTLTPPAWREDGMYTTARVFSGYAGTVDEIADHIGVSILGAGVAVPGEAEGRTGPIVTEISAGRSIDFVTSPGAGGGIVSIFEAAPRAASLPGVIVGTTEERPDDSDPGQPIANLTEDIMTIEEALARIAELEQALTDTTAALADATAALRDQTAGATIDQAVDEAGLPDLTADRLRASLRAQVPTTAVGGIDTEALATRISEAVTAAQAEIAAIRGDGRVRGVGQPPEQGTADLAEAQARIDRALAQLTRNGRG